MIHKKKHGLQIQLSSDEVVTAYLQHLGGNLCGSTVIPSNKNPTQNAIFVWNGLYSEVYLMNEKKHRFQVQLSRDEVVTAYLQHLGVKIDPVVHYSASFQ